MTEDIRNAPSEIVAYKYYPFFSFFFLLLLVPVESCNVPLPIIITIIIRPDNQPHSWIRSEQISP